jgi:hypothetical protein
VLRAMADGDGAAARAGGLALADEILDSDLVRLALAVRDGGPFMDRRIVELCKALRDEAAAAARRNTA